MQYYDIAIKNKKKYIDSISESSPIIKEILNKHIQENYNILQIKREWAPGGGSSLFMVTIEGKKIFLKVMSLEIPVESKLEGETEFITTPSIKNEYNFITKIKRDLKLDNVPDIIFYEEYKNFGFLATEWLAPFEDSIVSMSVPEIINTYDQIYKFIKALFSNGIVHTDIHENNIRFRGKVPVIIDYGETRFFKQDLSFEESLDYKGKNKYGNTGKIPIVKDNDIEGYTCLERLKKVFKRYLEIKLIEFSKECNFDNSCPFNRDICQQPDEKIYQSVNLDSLKIVGQRPINDERVGLVKRICKIFTLRYGKLVYIDIGSNLGNFCFDIAKLKYVTRCIGIEAFENYIIFANSLKFIMDEDKVVFSRFICGKEGIANSIKNNVNQYVVMSLMSVYHHIEDKEFFLSDLNQSPPVGMIIEFATQERYYPERKTWENESLYIQNKLHYRYSNIILRSQDYDRPIVVFTSDTIIYLVTLLIKAYYSVKKHIKQRY